VNRVIGLLFVAAIGLPAQLSAAYRAADQGVLLGVARYSAAHGAGWTTDVVLYNPGDFPADADLAYLPTGGRDNVGALEHLVHVGPIAPGGTIELPDVVGTSFGREQGLGALVFFGSRSDAPGLVAPLILTARVRRSGGPGAFGLIEPGLPYYDEGNPAASAVGADVHVLTGLEEDSEYRTNLGLWNGSDPTTSIVVRIDIFDASGRPAASREIALAPLAHVQIERALAALGSSGTGFSARVSIESFRSSGANPHPYFFAYGVVIENATGDPSFIEPAYGGEEPVSCIFP